MLYLLDSSFVIDLLNEFSDDIPGGPATLWLRENAKARICISAVTLAEVLEGAEHPSTVRSFLGRFIWQGIHQSHAIRVALIQRRLGRFGENDAWQVAIADELGAKIVSSDRKAFARIGKMWVDYKL